MAKTSLQLKSKSASTEQSITTTLTYVNPEADSQTLKTFAQKLNSLTTNIYDEANRVQTINVDTEEVPTQPTASTLTLNAKASYTRGNDHDYVNIPLSDFEYTGSGNLNNVFGICNATNDSRKHPCAKGNGENLVLGGNYPDTLSAGTYNLHLCVEGATEFENVVLNTQVNIA